LCKHAQPDIPAAIMLLTYQAKSLDKQDLLKLVKTMCYLNVHTMVLSADDSNSTIWHVDAAFAVHNDKTSHTGTIMLLGGGGIISISTK
jgi:ABC-type cobalamin transport system ATPase subunit